MSDMKRGIKRVFFILLLILIALFLSYFLIAYYYRDGFYVNTWINGVYCTGKTVEEVNTELKSGMKAPVITVTDIRGDSFSLHLEELGYDGDYLSALTRFKENQNPLLWVDNIAFHREHVLSPSFTYNETALEQAFLSAPPIERETGRTEDYLLARNGTDGYFLYDGKSNRLDAEKAVQVVKDAIREGETSVDLTAFQCYYDVPLTEEQERTRELWEKVEQFQNCSIQYDMGDAMIPLTPAVMADFLLEENGIPVTDEEGNFVLSEEGIAGFVASLAEEYDTYKKERSFQSTRGDVVTVQGSTYGTLLNQKAEVAYLKETLLTDEAHGSQVLFHIPSYEKEGVVRGKNDIGDTYIEIDLTEQKMYYYEAGELKLETEVVTGTTSKNQGTPEGVVFVYGKQKNRVLRGPGYAAPVKYWIPVVGNIGIHDSNWRKEFGGTIYQNNGSHGCINTPKDKVAELYDMVEIGTPVVIFS